MSKAIGATQDPSLPSRKPHRDNEAAILQASRPSRHVSPRSVPQPDVSDPFTLPPEVELLDLSHQYFGNTVSTLILLGGVIRRSLSVPFAHLYRP